MAGWSRAEIPDQHGRTAVVTGANTGLGFHTALALAAAGARVVVAARSLDKGREAVRAIEREVSGAELDLQRLDLGSLRAVHDAAAEVRERHERIDLLVNNAGVMFPKPGASTEDGFELQFGTNHLGHFALTGLLLDRLLQTPGSRVVTVTSNGHRQGRIDFGDLQWTRRRYSYLGTYGQSKLANLLFTYELQRRLAERRTISVAAHPGASSTALDRNTPWSLLIPVTYFRLIAQEAATGALPTLRAATATDVIGGQYFGPGGRGQWRGAPEPVKSSPRSHDAVVQQRLWAVSEELTGVHFPL